MQRKSRLPSYVLFVTLLLAGCQGQFSSSSEPALDKDITIIYTTDVHCGIVDNLGYSAVAACKEKLSESNYVALVDAGDFLQGDFVGAISQGKYVVDIMNEVGYDVVTLGNHEFDYGIDVLKDRISELSADVVSCNVSYIGKKEDKLAAVKPYVIKEYGGKKIGFVGITTPQTLVTSTPTNFYEDGELAYTFHGEHSNEFYALVQSNIDACKKDGADYVIMLSHLGDKDIYFPYSSYDVIANTSGAIAFLDGHAHDNQPWEFVKNKDAVDTYLVDTGYKLNEFATLTIGKDGKITTEFITKYEHEPTKIDDFIKGIEEQVQKDGSKVVANIDVSLEIADAEGHRLIRNGEMPIGNLVADAYRTMAGSDIAVVNGGGVRERLQEGDVTYMQIKNVHPFGNVLEVKKTKGLTILNYLEFTSMMVRKERVVDGKSAGEFGAFAHVSGLKYSVDTSIPTSVVLNEEGMFVDVIGPRRVHDVQVLVEGAYMPIDPEKTYTIASHNFLLDEGGDGAIMFVPDETVPSETRFDYEVVVSYIVDVCQGKLKEKYSSPEGRILID